MIDVSYVLLTYQSQKNTMISTLCVPGFVKSLLLNNRSAKYSDHTYQAGHLQVINNCTQDIEFNTKQENNTNTN